MKCLRLGNDLSLPLDAVSRTFGILAVRGAGKSNTAAVMAEEMFKASLPFVVIDPVGSWYGLRSSSNGKKPGLPIPIFGGKHADVPLERGAGEMLADLVVEKRLTCVLDLSRFNSEGDKKAFLLAFAQRLYQKNENPLHLFLEEADDYIPQKPMRDEAQLLRAWENIVRRGRARGLGITLITQRSAAVAKMVLTQVETLFAMRTTGPQDIAAIEAWIKYHQADQKVLESLASLEDGEAWIWSPHYLKTMSRHQIRRRHTFDSGATPKNVRASEKVKPATLADINLESITAQMSATIERAKAEDPRALRSEIARLKTELSKSKKEFTNTQGLTAADRKLLEKFARSLDESRDRFRQHVAELGSALNREIATLIGIVQESQKVTSKLPPVVNIHPHIYRPGPLITNREREVVKTKEFQSMAAESNGTIGKGERKTLIAIAQHTEGVTREQLTQLTGYKRSTRDAYIQRLGVADLIQIEANGRILATPTGESALGPNFSPLPTGRALAEHWLAKLPEGERKILEVLLAMFPKAVDREAIGERTGFKRSTRDAYIQRLAARKLVETDRGSAQAAPELFD